MLATHHSQINVCYLVCTRTKKKKDENSFFSLPLLCTQRHFVNILFNLSSWVSHLLLNWDVLHYGNITINKAISRNSVLLI